MANLQRGFGCKLIVALVWLYADFNCKAQERVTASESAQRAKESHKYAGLLRFVSIPAHALPERVQLKEWRIRDIPLIPITRNPQVLDDPLGIEPVAKFFGLREKSKLENVCAAVVAIYEEKSPKGPVNEIGVYGVYFSNENHAKSRFQVLAKDKEDAPFLLKGKLLLYVWKDDGASNSALDSIKNYLRTAKFRPMDHG